MSARPTPPSFLRRGPAQEPTLSKATIEQLVEQKVCSILAAQRSQKQPMPLPQVPPPPSPPRQQSHGANVSEEVQRRLASIEQRLEGQEGARAEGLSFLLMAKQHQARGEEGSALKMYQMARPYFPGNEKLERKIEALQGRIEEKRKGYKQEQKEGEEEEEEEGDKRKCEDDSYHDDNPPREDTQSDEEQASFSSSSDDCQPHRHTKKRTKPNPRPHSRPRLSSPDPLAAQPQAHPQATLSNPSSHDTSTSAPPTPRTTHLLSIINSRDITQIKRLKGVGPKRAEGIVESLAQMDGGEVARDGKEGVEEVVVVVRSLRQLSALRGVGDRIVEGMKLGIGF